MIYENGFNPNQPRDKNGQWTDGPDSIDDKIKKSLKEEEEMSEKEKLRLTTKKFYLSTIRGGADNDNYYAGGIVEALPGDSAGKFGTFDDEVKDNQFMVFDTRQEAELYAKRQQQKMEESYARQRENMSEDDYDY